MTPAPPPPAAVGPPRRVVWLVQGDEIFGARQAAVSLSVAVRAAGWDVGMAALAPGPFADECRGLGFPVADLGVGRSPVLGGNLARKAAGFLGLVRYHRRAAAALTQWLTAEARAGRPADAVHVQWPSLVGVAGAAARSLGVPCFWEMPNALGDRYPFGLNRRIYQRQCRRFGVVPLSNSAYTGASLGGPIRARVMHLGVDADRFDPAKVVPVARGDLGIPDDAAVLSVAGRLDPQKGQDRVLRAMLAVAGDAGTPPLHLLLLGGPTDGPFAAGLRSVAAAANAGDRLHLLGTRPDPERYYGPTDVAVNARVDAEPYGLSVVEAMMMSRPVLVHALGGPAETVVDGQTGWHVREPTVEAIAAGIRRAIADRPRWPQMRQFAREHALAHFTVERQARFFMGVVDEVLAARGR